MAVDAGLVRNVSMFCAAVSVLAVSWVEGTVGIKEASQVGGKEVKGGYTIDVGGGERG